MKNIAKPISLLCLSLLALILTNCGGGGSEAAPEKVELKKLSKQWSLVDVSLSPGVPNPDQIDAGFTLTISGSYSSDSPSGPYDYSVTGVTTPSPWPTSGTWTFAGEPGKNSGTIQRDDGIVISYSINSADQLTLIFTYSGARVSQVDGTWTFVLE